MGHRVDLQHPISPRGQGMPIYRQLYGRYRDAIATGKLRAGDRVPSVRSLASELNLARGTVELAYQMLAGEGYFLARGPAGTFVAPGLGNPAEPIEPVGLAGADGSAPAARAPRRPAQAPHPRDAVRPFQPGLPALDAFPRKTWARLAGRRLRALDAAALAYPDPAGYGPLRHAIAAYLGIARGIACAPEQVFVTSGYRGALELVCRTVLAPGDAGWYEDPGYLQGRRFLERAGMRLEPVPVDGEGLVVQAGERRAARARFAVVTPTHQSPTGVPLALPRRMALLDWAVRRQAWIVEDDYDGEFRHHGRPIPALKSLDRDGRVLYTGTFSKVLFPGLRLAYLVVPAPQAGAFRDMAGHLPGPGSDLLQATVADFMEQGHFARHLRRMRALYAQRRGYLVDALRQTFGARLRVPPQAGGLHVLALLPSGQGDTAWAAAARAQGLAVQALSDWRMRPSSPGGLLMGFANFATPDQAVEAVRRLGAVAPVP
jgi:GntR family transcriptional regulator/MocR family aminotransferase